MGAAVLAHVARSSRSDLEAALLKGNGLKSSIFQVFLKKELEIASFLDDSQNPLYWILRKVLANFVMCVCR